MAATFQQIGPAGALWVQEGNLKRALVNVKGDNSYPTGGYQFLSNTFGALGMLSVIGMDVIATNLVATVRGCVWDNVNNKVVLMAASGAEVTNATNLTALLLTIEVWGR